MGRVRQRYDNDFAVDLPDGKSVFATESQIWVRCAEIGDPMDTLLVRGHETVFFQAPRMRFVRSVLRQRSGYRGLTALASAPIELYPHQVEIVRRVLEDPVLRYLLADEVGLGKTIEAGVIARQLLLDDPHVEVLVAVPGSLLAQWRGELKNRLGISESSQVVVCTHEELGTTYSAPTGLLVIDEAHRVADLAYSRSSVERARFAKIARQAQQTPRLLLLSATPASSNQRQFLAMLHLLDETTYRLEDLGSFELRVAKRQDIGRALLMLTEDAAPFAIKMALKRLSEMLPHDVAIASMVQQLDAQLSSPNGMLLAKPMVRQLRAHVGETYRLHRRMLRNRRASWDGNFLSKRAGEDRSFAPHVIDDADARTAELHDVLDDWRSYAFDAIQHETSQDDPDRTSKELAVAELLQHLLQCAATSHEQLRAIICKRLADEETSVSQDSSELALRQTSTRVAHFPEERAILRRLLDILNRSSTPPARFAQLGEFLRELRERSGVQATPKCVVFCPDSLVVESLTKILASRLSSRSIAAVSCEVSDVAEVVSRFETNRDCFVLVADAIAEEGLNLQFADYVIEIGLPWSANRLEQQIGRVHRIGRTKPVRTVVFSVPGDSSMYESWLQLLRDGLRIFEESTAGLQFFIEARRSEIARALLAEGAQGLRRLLPTLRDAIRLEQSHLAEQAALDEIDATTEHTSRFFSVLDDIDAEHADMQKAFEDWACTVLKLERDRSTLQEHVTRYSATQYSLVPAGILRSGVGLHHHDRCTFRREVATREDGVSLVRVGHNLVDALWRYVEWDDRGRAYAIWRYIPSFPADEGSEWCGFKLHFMVEPNADAIRDALKASHLPAGAWRAIQRRADAILPPFLEVLYFDVDGVEVRDSAIRASLKPPGRRTSDGGSDANLHKDRTGVIDSLVTPGHWEWACKSVRRSAEERLRALPKFCQSIEDGLREAERQAQLEEAILSARASVENDLMVDSRGAHDATKEQRVIARALRDAIANPTVRLDSVGFIVLSGRQLPELGRIDA